MQAKKIAVALGVGALGFVLVSSTAQAQLLADSTPDSFYLYGGPGSLEGRFETSEGLPDRQGWVGVDRTEKPPYWQFSEFNAANLDEHRPRNTAAWCGFSRDQQPGWASAPGYGNNWFAELLFERDVVDVSMGQTVTLDFQFNHDTEAEYDFFEVQYDSAGSWKSVFSVSGTNRSESGVFPPPGVQYSSASPRPIVFAGNDYAEAKLRLRLLVSSDGGWSDEDGAIDTEGAVQVDNIFVRFDDGTGTLVEVLEDFEGSSTHDWTPAERPVVGDFSKVLSGFLDLDPTRDNTSPALTFVDDGTPPSNDPSQTSTGGETSLNWSYGFPGNWVVNFHGGLIEGATVWNEVWSPLIAWDLPGPEDDDPTLGGATLRFDLWAHLPQGYPIRYLWHVRSSLDDGVSWTSWDGPGLTYFEEGPRWLTIERDVTGYVASQSTHVQLALGVFQWNGIHLRFDATPSPIFDNVSLIKHRPKSVVAIDAPTSSRSRTLSVSPNPFNPTTSVVYSALKGGRVQIRVLDTRGTLVRGLLDQWVEPGIHQLRWDGRDDGGRTVASGVYFVEMRAGSESVVRKATVLK